RARTAQHARERDPFGADAGAGGPLEGNAGRAQGPHGEAQGPAQGTASRQGQSSAHGPSRAPQAPDDRSEEAVTAKAHHAKGPAHAGPFRVRTNAQRGFPSVRAKRTGRVSRTGTTLPSCWPGSQRGMSCTAATAASSQPPPMPRRVFTSVTRPSTSTTKATYTVPSTPSARACSG